MNALKIKKGLHSTFMVGLKAFGLLFVFSMIIYFLGWAGEAGRVAKEEFGPRAALAKYEWFKDASAALDRKAADIAVYQSRLAALGEDRTSMDRADKEQFGLWTAEVAGVTASYNHLAAQWNAQISKFNWRPFLADLPPGAEGVLTREYAPYRRN